MNELIKEDNIENMIYEIRGIEVMLDSDLARIYKCKNGTKEVNQAVKNNIDKFPERFSWKLTDEEISILRSKILTTNISTMSRSNPRVFTEQGVYMLSTILKTNIATEVTLKIMDTFVKMRHMLINNQNVLPNRLLLLEDKVDSNTKRIDELFNKFSNNDINSQYTFYKGAFYDTYSLFLDILFKGVNEIIIIDNYAGHELLDMIKDVNKVIIQKEIEGESEKEKKERLKREEE